MVLYPCCSLNLKGTPSSAFYPIFLAHMLPLLHITVRNPNDSGSCKLVVASFSCSPGMYYQHLFQDAGHSLLCHPSGEGRCVRCYDHRLCVLHPARTGLGSKDGLNAYVLNKRMYKCISGRRNRHTCWTPTTHWEDGEYFRDLIELSRGWLDILVRLLPHWHSLGFSSPLPYTLCEEARFYIKQEMPSLEAFLQCQLHTVLCEGLGKKCRVDPASAV